MQWLYSTNAKEIGTLYLIFAIFSGMFFMLELYFAFCWNNYLIVNNRYLPLIIIYMKKEEKKVKNFIINFIIKSAENYNHFLRDFMQKCLNNLKFCIKTKWKLLLYCNETKLISFIIADFYHSIKIYNIYFTRFNHTLIENKNISKNNKLSNNLDANDNTYSNKKNIGELGYYLAGLIESYGSIIIPTLESINTPTISIIFNIKDKPLAEHIIFVLGYGTIQKSQSDLAINLVIRNKLGIIDLLNLINGKFRTPKILRLHNLIDWVNNNPNYAKLNNSPLIKLPIDNSHINDNAWLSGFSEGDSTFQIRISEGIKYNNITTTYEISQTRLNPSLLEDYKPIMESIANLFFSNVSIINLINLIDQVNKKGEELEILVKLERSCKIFYKISFV